MGMTSAISAVAELLVCNADNSSMWAYFDVNLTGLHCSEYYDTPLSFFFANTHHCVAQ